MPLNMSQQPQLGFGRQSCQELGAKRAERSQVPAEVMAQKEGWGREGWASEPDVGAAVSPRVAELMGQGWAEGLLPKVHQEVRVQLQSSLYCVYIDLQHHGAFPCGKEEGMKERSDVAVPFPQEFVSTRVGP